MAKNVNVRFHGDHIKFLRELMNDNEFPMNADKDNMKHTILWLCKKAGLLDKDGIIKERSPQKMNYFVFVDGIVPVIKERCPNVKGNERDTWGSHRLVIMLWRFYQAFCLTDLTEPTFPDILGRFLRHDFQQEREGWDRRYKEKSKIFFSKRDCVKWQSVARG